MADEIVTADAIGAEPAKRGRPRKAVEPELVPPAEVGIEPGGEPVEPDLEPSPVVVQTLPLPRVAPPAAGYAVLVSPGGFSTTVPESLRATLIESGYTEK